MGDLKMGAGGSRGTYLGFFPPRALLVLDYQAGSNGKCPVMDVKSVVKRRASHRIIKT